MPFEDDELLYFADDDLNVFSPNDAESDCAGDDTDDLNNSGATSSIEMQHMSNLICYVLEFYANLGGTSREFLDLLH